MRQLYRLHRLVMKREKQLQRTNSSNPFTCVKTTIPLQVLSIITITMSMSSGQVTRLVRSRRISANKSFNKLD